MRRLRAGSLTRFLLAASVLASGLLSPFAEEAFDLFEPVHRETSGFDLHGSRSPDGPGLVLTPGPSPVAGLAHFLRRGCRPGIALVGWMTRASAHDPAGDNAEPADPCVPAAIVDWSFCPEDPKERNFCPWDLPPSPTIIPILGYQPGQPVPMHLEPSPDGRSARSPLLRC